MYHVDEWSTGCIPTNTLARGEYNIGLIGFGRLSLKTVHHSQWAGLIHHILTDNVPNTYARPPIHHSGIVQIERWAHSENPPPALGRSRFPISAPVILSRRSQNVGVSWETQRSCVALPEIHSLGRGCFSSNRSPPPLPGPPYMIRYIYINVDRW